MSIRNTRRTVFGGLAAALLAAAVVGAGQQAFAPSGPGATGTHVSAAGGPLGICDARCVANGWQGQHP
ncbi:hypothetical protein ACLQ2N_27580 [Streptomyces sp. DT224]|uniref:hypothetical protein n=1 Tax=Streptomyces sp. DT224 TaxID=3393426 RepID=UPI003CEC6B0F